MERQAGIPQPRPSALERLCKWESPCAPTHLPRREGPEGAGGLGKPLQPSRAWGPGVMLSLLMLRGSGVGYIT